MLYPLLVIYIYLFIWHHQEQQLIYCENVTPYLKGCYDQIQTGLARFDGSQYNQMPQTTE